MALELSSAGQQFHLSPTHAIGHIPLVAEYSYSFGIFTYETTFKYPPVYA
jgi:hypothetical protein